MNLVSDELLIAEARNWGIDKREAAEKEFEDVEVK